MSNDISHDPLEGKGEEMIPEKGLPFDDIDETPLEDIPPEERIPDFEENDVVFDDEQPLLEEIAFDDEETDLSESDLSEGSEEIASEDFSGFEFTAEEAEALIGDFSEAFGTEATPWSLSEEEADALMGDVGEAFTPRDAFGEGDSEEMDVHVPADAVPMVQEFDQPPDDLADQGMGTHLEDASVTTEGAHTDEHLFSRASFQDPGPQAPVDAQATTQHPAQKETKPMVNLLVTDKDMQALWRRADEAQQNVTRHISTLYIAQPMLDHIQSARNELMAGKKFYEDAERHINEVEYRVELIKKLDKWSTTLIPWLFLYIAVWFVGLIVAIFLIGDGIFAGDALPLTMLAGSMIWGGMGGIIGALLPLIKHFSTDRDFARSHVWWYITSPFVGSVMGAVIYLVMSSGLISIAGGSSIITYILAGLAGYQHNVFTDLVKQLLKKLELKPKEESENKKTEETPPQEEIKG